MAIYYTIGSFKTLICSQSSQFEQVASIAVGFKPSLCINRYGNLIYRPRSTSKSFENVSLAIEQLRSAEIISQELSVASVEFRPLHQSVRSIERDIRRHEKEIKHIKSKMK